MARLIDQQSRGTMFRPAQVRSVMADIDRQAEVALAEYALWYVKALNAQDFKNPTGRYRSRLHIVRRGAIEVNDSNSVYGPWLEGTGSRNARSRFKGYHHWRRTRQQVERQARRIADGVVARNIRRLSR